ncbi:hypothetical protein ACYFX5_26940 [Bremerella sp. T1]|uniref:hypothetical protein n=1 Tax=Bremerella sp. TYQ1 TaxID=3119568 RepID=UPI001CCB06AC|nr:hypothetical protein [Bremerella volcania]UBM36646.1 hypothetical protein LA756_01790 [Bremerella volcania]
MASFKEVAADKAGQLLEGFVIPTVLAVSDDGCLPVTSFSHLIVTRLKRGLGLPWVVWRNVTHVEAIWIFRGE